MARIQINRIITKIALLPIVLFCHFLFFMARPFVIVQVYLIDFQFGHLLSMTHANELRNLTWNRTHARKKCTLYCFPGPYSSRYAINKLAENVPVVVGNIAWLFAKVSQFIPNASIYFKKDTQLQYYEDLKPLIKFNEDEVDIGKSLIKGHQSIFVCLNVRDAAYNNFLNNALKINAKSYPHRDSKIEDYLKALTYLTRMGYTIYRMGSLTSSKLKTTDPKIIDYSNNGMRSEFLDFYLGANCKFAISTGSGWDEIPVIFQRPLLQVNLFDFLSESALRRTTLIYPKKFISKQSGLLLDLRQIIEVSIPNSHLFKNKTINSDNQLGVVDLSSEELVDAVTEMAQRVEGTFVETPEQKEMQAKLKHILSTHPKLQPSPNYYPIRAQFASCFLSRYPNFLDGLD